MATLVIETGPADAGLRIPLTREQLTIGRHPECEVLLKNDGRVSRKHAEVLRHGDDYFVKDLNSRAGTFVNGQPLADQPQLIQHGDRIVVCDFTILFQDESRSRGTVTDKATVGVHAHLVDDEEGQPSTGSTIMSRSQVAVSSGTDGMVQMASSIEARFSALIEITRSLGKALVLDDVLPQVLKSLFKIFLQADRGAIVLQAENGDLVPRWTKLRGERGDETVRISRTIIRRVMESREAILSADATRDERLDLSQSIADLRIRSMMCAPLLDSEGKAFGAMQIDTLDQRKRFRQEDLEVLASVALQAGVAIDLAQLHERALLQKELDKDLELAREVQQGFLPQNHPQLPGYEFYKYYHAANQVGGDYYDYVALPDGRTAVVVADVVGHGIAAAMMMAKLSGEAKYCLASEAQPAAALTMLNERLCVLCLDRFVTMIMVVMDAARHEATIVNAGHMAPLWRHTDGSIEEPGEDIAGLPLGIRGGTAYEQTSIGLQPGESLTLYTDGINEAMNARNEQFTIERLRNHLRRAAGNLQTTGETIIADVRQFLGGAAQSDDMCLVSLGRTA